MARKKSAASKSSNRVDRDRQRVETERLSVENEYESRWSAFTRRFRNHPALQNGDTHYALPAQLLDSIENHVPGFFAPTDLIFERALTSQFCGGTFLERPFGYLTISEVPQTKADQRAIKNLSESAQRIREIQDTALKSSGHNLFAVKSARGRESIPNRKLVERREGFAGWLLTNSRFRQERDELCEEVGSTVRQDGGFPAFPRSLFWESAAVPNDRREQFSSCTNFYRKWGLDRLATWELPVPMHAEIDSPSFYDLNQLQSAGVVVFLPWHLLRFSDLRLVDVVRKQQAEAASPDLNDWLKGQPKNCGPRIFALMLRLYVFIELALRRRYPDRIDGNIETLDAAISDYCRPADAPDNSFQETVRKTRQKMNRRLKRSDG